MNQAIQDFQAPAAHVDVVQESEYQNEWATHYGILVGGSLQIDWSGIGDASVGHSAINRRVWMTFNRLRVGIRPEHEGALDSPQNSIQMNWATNPERLRWKSPRACAQDVLASFRPQGYCVPETLIGHANAQTLVDVVWPRIIRDGKRLWEQIEYFESFTATTDEEAQLAEELLQSCYLSRSHTAEYVRTIKTEIESPKGLRNLNGALKELFYEVNEPLPEHKTALVASAMGREIVQATQGDGRKDDAMINALNSIAEGQRALTARLDRLETEPRKVQDSDIQEGASSDGQTPNTQPRRGPGRPPKSSYDQE